jgi:PAS domain S-box-containing protein
VAAETTEHVPAERGLAAQYAAARILAEAGSLRDAAPRLLEAICVALGWELGTMWRVDEESNELRCVAFWHAPEVAAPEFQTLTEQLPFPYGEGIPGRVWMHGKPLWLTSVFSDARFPRSMAAARAGIKCSFLFPILLGSEVLGVIEVYSTTPREPDEAILEMMGALGSQIGQFIERKDAEEALRESEARKAAILEASLDCVITMDHRGRIIEWNRAAERTFGYTRAEAIGQPLAELIIPSGLRELHAAGLAHYLATGDGHILGRRVELGAIRANGEQFPVEITVTAIRRQGTPIFTGFLRDITARKQVEDERAHFLSAEQAARSAAEKAERRAAFLAEASKVLASSLDYETTLANVAPLAVPELADWCAIYLLEDDGTVRLSAVAHADPSKAEKAREIQQRHPPPPGLLRVLETGCAEVYAYIPADAAASSARDEDELAFLRDIRSGMRVALKARGRVIGALTLFSAESRRHYGPSDLALAEELGRRVALAVDNSRLYREAQEANRVKDEFLATLSHELCTPLAAILSWSHLLRTGRLDVEKRARAIETIERNAKAQARLIEDILDVSRVITGKLRLELRPVDLVPAIGAALDAVRPPAEAKGVELASAVDTAVGVIRGDPDRLQQVVWNLLSNAIKFTPAGGRVEVRLARVDGEAELSVSDTGEGIRPGFLPYVFDRFRQADSTSTRAHGGLGLGLSIARHLVELQGGRIEAHSRGIGRGATFTVRLPIYVEGDVSRSTPATGDGATRLDGLRVLLVDDDQDARELFAATLEERGAAVTAVGSAREALSTLAVVRPHVLVSDIAMPGEDGHALMRKVRALDHDGMASVALTAYGGPEHEQRALDAGFQAHVVKTAAADELAAVVARLARRSARA